MTLKYLIDSVVSEVTENLAGSASRVILSDRFLEPPYPAGFRLSVVRHDNTAEFGFNELGVSLWDSTKAAKYIFMKRITTTDPVRDLPPAIHDLFRQFNEQCWTTRDLLAAWKDMPCQNYATPFDPIGIPYLHFGADDEWQAVFDWFSEQGERHERPIIQRTLYLEKRDAEYYADAMSGELDYAASNIDEDSRVACYEVSFGDLWTVEYCICAGEKDTPLYSMAILLFDGNPVLPEEDPSNHTVLGRWEFDGFPGRFVRFILDVKEKPDEYTGYFQGKTLENKWASGYLKSVPAQTRRGEPRYYIQNSEYNGIYNTVTSEVTPDSLAPYIGVMDLKGKLVFGNSVLKHSNGQQFTPRWNRLRCCWELVAVDSGEVYPFDDPLFRGDAGCDDQFINLEVIGNTYDGIC